MLTLNHPIDDLRPKFRAIWSLYLKGNIEQAQHDLDTLCHDSIRSLLETCDDYSIQSIQSAFNEEKRRIEDIEEVTAKVIQAFNSVTATEQPNSPQRHGSETYISHSDIINTLPATSRTQFPDPAAPDNNGGGLDLAGMIDSMLATENQN